MNKWNLLVFCLVAALAMNGLDMGFHLATGTAVHLGYVAVKLTIIFLSVYLISRFVGITARDGVVASVFGPFMFWLYYLFAYPTLDRAVFRLDEQFYFFFAHVFMMLVAYFSVWFYSRRKNVFCLLLSCSLVLYALDLLYLMIGFKLAGMGDADSAVLLASTAPSFLFVLYAAIAVGFAVFVARKHPLIAGFAVGLLLSLFLAGSVVHGVFLTLVTGGVVFAVRHLEHGKN